MEANRYRDVVMLVCLLGLAMLSWPAAGVALLPSIPVTPTAFTVGEPGDTGSFNIRLQTAPTADVTIALSTSNAQCSIAVAEVVLTTANWEAGVDLDVSAEDDRIDDGDQDCVVQTAAAVSEDTDYHGTDPADVTVTVEDDDTAGFTVTPTALTVTEPAGTKSFNVRLNSEPTADVTIGLSTSNLECSVPAAPVKLTSANWQGGVNVPVTAVDDSIADGDRTCVVRMASASADPKYGNKNPADVTVTVQDDDTAGITVTPTTLTVSEPSGSASFAIKLNSQPSAGVVVGLSVASPECSVAVSSVTLTDANWQGGVNVVVSAVNDSVDDGDQTCVVQTAAAVSTDGNYTGKNPADVTVTVQDDDTAGITVTPTTLTVSEPSGSAGFTIRLASQPTANVTIGLSTSNAQCSVGAASVTLNSTTWITGQVVLVSAVDDDLIDGDQPCVIRTAAATSGDGKYAGKNPANVSVTVQDDDAAGILVSPTTLTVNEPSSTSSFNIRLDSRPTADVIVGLSVSNAECSVATDSVTLTVAGWATGVNVSVAAVDDSIADGDRPCVVQTAPATSGDGNYNGANAPDVTVTVHDDDVVAVLVYPTLLTVSEPAGSAGFSIGLASQPIRDVTIGLSPSNAQCSVLPSSVTLTGANWRTGQEVTVSAVDDRVDEDDQTCVVLTGAAVSSDPLYDGVNAFDVTVTVQDDDTGGIVVSPTSLTVSEPDGAAVFSVTLATAPVATVTLTLTATNDECRVSPESVVLTADEWPASAAITVTAVDDLIQDGDQVCVVQVQPAVSADPKYHNRDPEDVTITVLDNDQYYYLTLIVRNWPPIPQAPLLVAIDNPGGDGAYRVEWRPVDGATGYLLQEAKDGAFVSAGQVYSGTLATFDVAARGAARYYYRVKAQNEWGYGPWSNVQAVDVLWEAEPDDQAPTELNGPLVSGLTYFGTMPSSDDTNDYFYIFAAAAGWVELWLDNIPAGQNYDLVLRDDPALNAIGYSGELGNTAEHISVAVPAAGRYYIQIFNRGKTGSSQPYQLRAVY